jgi:hypothetical protein
MTTPHKWAEVIKAWADGKTVQYMHHSSVWLDWTERATAFPGCLNYPWRIKPEEIWYRRYIYQSGTTYVGVAVSAPMAKAVEQSSTFIRWIDVDWQTVEV